MGRIDESCPKRYVGYEEESERQLCYQFPALVVDGLRVSPFCRLCSSDHIHRRSAGRFLGLAGIHRYHQFRFSVVGKQAHPSISHQCRISAGEFAIDGDYIGAVDVEILIETTSYSLLSLPKVL